MDITTKLNEKGYKGVALNAFHQEKFLKIKIKQVAQGTRKSNSVSKKAG